MPAAGKENAAKGIQKKEKAEKIDTLTSAKNMIVWRNQYVPRLPSPPAAAAFRVECLGFRV